MKKVIHHQANTLVPSLQFPKDIGAKVKVDGVEWTVTDGFHLMAEVDDEVAMALASASADARMIL